MKILFINLPYTGHIVPTIGLVNELINLGCDVTYMLPFGWENQLDGCGARFHGYKNHPQLAEQIKNAILEAQKIITGFDMVVYEQFFFLGKHLAEKYSKPAVRIFSSYATNKHLMDEIIKSGGALGIFRYKCIAKAFTKDIAKDFTLKTDNWLDEITENTPRLNLVYTSKETQPYFELFDKAKFKFIGPSVYERNGQYFNFNKSDRPLVYISLGTVIKGGKKFFNSCIDAFRDENIDVIISAGKKFDAGKLKNIPSNIHIYNFVDQLHVLKMADVFITHGGMNSISEALVHKVPMVVIPFYADQPRNAQTIKDIGAGIVLNFSQASANSIKSSVYSLLDNTDISNNMDIIHSSMSAYGGNQAGAEYIINYYNSI